VQQKKCTLLDYVCRKRDQTLTASTVVSVHVLNLILSVAARPARLHAHSELKLAELWQIWREALASFDDDMAGQDNTSCRGMTSSAKPVPRIHLRFMSRSPVTSALGRKQRSGDK
jgi:hypothetical protein